MSNMPDLTQFTTLGGFIGLLAYIIWQDWRGGKFKGDSNSDKMDTLTELSGKMTTLASYVNHNQTTIMEKHTEILTEIKDGIKDVQYSFKDMKENGLKCK